VMTSEEEQRPTLITPGYGWRKGQWVNKNSANCFRDTLMVLMH